MDHPKIEQIKTALSVLDFARRSIVEDYANINGPKQHELDKQFARDMSAFSDVHVELERLLEQLIDGSW
jgi:hypothetical protein